MSRDTQSQALGALGFDARLRSDFARFAGPHLSPARVVADHGVRLLVDAGDGARPAVVRGALLHEDQRPAVGDWVAVGPPEGDLVPIEGLSV